MGNITVFSAAMAVLAFSRGALENAFPTHAFVRAAISVGAVIQYYTFSHTVKRRIKRIFHHIKNICIFQLGETIASLTRLDGTGARRADSRNAYRPA